MAVVTYEDLVKSGYGTAGFGAGDQGTTFADLGTYGLISSKYGPLQAIDAPLSNKGNATSQISGTTNTFSVSPQTAVRLVDNSTGKVVFEGTGYEAAQTARDLAQGLSDTGGNKANWDIQAAAPGMSNFATVANEKPNKSAIGTVADIGLPILASALVPGGGFLGTILPAAAGSAVSSVAQGRSLQDTLLRAAIAGGGAGLGEGIFGAGVPSGNAVAPTASLASDVLPNLPSLLDDIAATAAQNVASAGLGSVAPALLPSIAGDIVATAIKTAAPSIAGSAIGSTAGSALSSALLPETIVQAQTQAPTQPDTPPVTPPVSFPENILVNAQTQAPTQPDTPPVTPPVASPSDILVNAQTQPTNLVPASLLAGGGAAAAAAANAAGSTTSATDTAASRTGMTDAELAAVNAGAGGGGVLGTGLSATQLATLGSLGISGLSSLFGNAGGGIGPTTPYVSPFGAGTGFGTGMDYRAQPNILDYERYGFGPEATFFRPEYNRLIPTAAAPVSSFSTNPAYGSQQQAPSSAGSILKAANIASMKLLGAPFIGIGASNIYNQEKIDDKMMEKYGVNMQDYLQNSQSASATTPTYQPLI
jgi:hypothetical protein